MGDCTSKSTNVIDIVSDTINQNLTALMVSTQNSNSAQCISNQNISLNIGRYADICGGLDLSQQANVNCNLSSIFTTNSQNDLSTIAMQAIDQSANSSNKVVQDFLSTSVSDSSNNISMKNHIKNIVSKSITNDTKNTCIAQASVNQNQTIVIDGKVACRADGKPQNFAQNAQVSVLSSCITNSIAGTISNDSVVQKSTQSGSASNDTQQKGFGDLIKGIFDGLNTGFMIIAFVVVACVIAAAYILLSPAGQASLNKATDAAMKKL